MTRDYPRLARASLDAAAVTTPVVDPCACTHARELHRHHHVRSYCSATVAMTGQGPEYCSCEVYRAPFRSLLLSWVNRWRRA
jgi:hypothetical protein